MRMVRKMVRMNKRMTTSLAIIAGVFIQVASGNELDFGSPEGALRHDMLILDADVRNSALAGYKRRFNLSDDEFSERLVKLAAVTTNGQDATLRMFTVAAIGDFGTTNALGFLENEVRRGNIVAISEYGVITGYDDRFFELAEPLVVDKRKQTWGRREPVYNAFRSLLNKKDIRNREIPLEIRKRAIAHLISWANEDVYYADYIDQILSAKEEAYRTNAIRSAIARFALNNPESSDYTRNYFKAVLEQMGDYDVTAKERPPSVRGSRGSGKQTDTNIAECASGLTGGKEKSSPPVEHADIDMPSTHTRPCIMVFGVLLFALTFLLVRLRKRRDSLCQRECKT